MKCLRFAVTWGISDRNSEKGGVVGGRFFPVFFTLALTISITACGTVFDFAPVPREKGVDRTNLTEIKGEAEKLAEEYQSRASQAANSAQMFELPMIGAAITAVTALAFGAHPDVALAAGAVGGGSAVLGNYYNPRERAKIYLDGNAAMSCIADLAQMATGRFNKSNFQSYFTGTFRPNIAGQGVAAATIEANAIRISAKAMTTKPEVARKLSGGMNRINAAILRRVQTASAVPNMDAIMTQMRQSLEAANKQKALLEEALRQAGVPEANIAGMLLTAQISLDLDVDSEVTKCVSKAGGT